MTTQPQHSSDELNQYGVPTWLIGALKSYDGLMSSDKGRIKGNKMKAKRQLASIIRQKELEAAIQSAEGLKKYMISTSPFIGQIVNPHIEALKMQLAQLNKEREGM